VTAALPSRFCSVVKCRALLETTIDRFGRAHTSCPACDRRRAGLCVDCGRAPEPGKWRCAADRRRRDNERARRSWARYPERKRAQRRRRRLARTPEQVAAERERRRLARLANLEAHKERCRRYVRAHPIGLAVTRRRYYLAHRAELIEREKRRYRATHPEPSRECQVCGADTGWRGVGRVRRFCPPHWAVLYYPSGSLRPVA
jgi:hypothetical protein